jgi:hypothetical protein
MKVQEVTRDKKPDFYNLEYKVVMLGNVPVSFTYLFLLSFLFNNSSIHIQISIYCYLFISL